MAPREPIAGRAAVRCAHGPRTRSRLDLPIDDAHPVPPVVASGPRPQDTRRVALPVLVEPVGQAPGAIAELVRPPGVPEQPFGLSPRELEVLLILGAGRTDREIAERLFISQRTVHIHVRRVLAKLGATSRTQATSIAWRAGVLPTSPANPGVR